MSTEPRFDSDAYPHLVALLTARAIEHPDRRAYTFLKNGEQERQHLTYAQVDGQARAIAALLHRHGLAGQQILLVYPPNSLEFVTAFFGCLYAGVIAVPVYPPQRGEDRERFMAIAQDVQASTVLTTKLLYPAMAWMTRMAGLHWIATDWRVAKDAKGFQPPTLSRDDLAFLQYTSGSTSQPKGVMVTHGNLMANHRIMQEVLRMTSSEVVVSWLPMYHEMGLIGCILQTVYTGYSTILMSPLDFLQRPMRWLEALSRYRATASAAPNFAYELCVRKSTLEERAALDLTSWRIALNGAEPVRAETLERFSDAFAISGFQRDAFYPTYGLAEATLLVSGGKPEAAPVDLEVSRHALMTRHEAIAWEKPSDAQTLIGCGQAAGGQLLEIVDPETLRPCASGRVGEIWLSGPSVAN